MDIVLDSGKCDGIEAVKRLAPAGCGTQVVYVTGHLEYCTKVYQTEHVYLLIKPVAQSDLYDALYKALANLERIKSRPITIQTGGTLHVLAPGEISFIESDRRKVRIHQGQEVIEAYASLAELSEKLPPSFVRCHKGFLVNMDYIAELQSADVRLRSGELVPLSQRRRSAVRESFIGHLRGRS